MSITKEQFVQAVWALIKSANCTAMDAVMDVAERNKLDMDTVARIIMYNQPLKAAVAAEAGALRLLKPIPPKA